MSRKKFTPALAYFRTSSATNVGPDRDSEKRQRETVAAFARRAGYAIEAELLRRISAELKAAGYLNERGREFNPNSIKSMISGPQPRSEN